MKKLLFTFILFSLFSAVGILLLFTTETGLRWMVHTGAGLSGETVQVGKVSGSFFSKWKIEELAIKTPAAHVSVFECSGDWQPGRLLDKTVRVTALQAQGVAIRLQEEDGAGVIEEETAALDLSSLLSLPFSLFLDSVRINNLTLWDSDGTELVVVDALSFGLEGVSSQFTLSDFVLSAPGYGLDLRGTLDAKKQGTVQIDGNLSYLLEDVGQLTGNMRIEGPLSLLSFEANIFPPVPLKVVGEIHGLFSSPAWRADIGTTGFQLGDVVPQAGDVFIRGEGSASGDLQKYSGTIGGAVNLPEFGELVLDTSFAGDLYGIVVKKADVQVPFGRAEVYDTRLAWSEGIEWDGKLFLKDVDPGVIDSAYSAKLSAKVTSSGSYQAARPIQGNIVVEQFKGFLRGREIDGKGRVNVENNVVDITGLEVVNEASVLSVDGKARMEHGLLNWQKPLGWDLTVRLQDFDPSILYPDYPGQLNAHLTSSGIHENEKVTADAAIRELQGSLRGYPLSGTGKFVLHDSLVELEDVVLKSGHSTMTVQGDVNERLNLSVALTSSDIGEIVAGGGGTLELQGTVSGTRAIPQADVVFDLAGLYYDNLNIEALHGHFSGSSVSDAEIAGYLRGNGIDFGDIHVQNVNLAVDGDAGSHTMAFDMETGGTAVAIKVQGSIAERKVWKSELVNMRVDSSVLGAWQLADPVNMEVSQEAVQGEEICVSSGAERICLSGSWSAENNSWDGNLNWHHVNLGRLDVLQLLPHPVKGRTVGTVALQGNGERVSSSNIHLEITDGRIGEKGSRGDWELLDFKHITLDTVLENEMLKSDLVLLMDDGNRLDASAVVPGVGNFQQDYGSLPLAGEVIIAAVNLDFVAPLTNYYVYPEGDLRGELALSGILSNPLASGELTLFNGKIGFPTFGVALHDAIFKVIGEGVTLQLWGEGTSGPGRLYADGSLTFERDDVEGEFNFVGQNIDTFKLPEYEIRTSPDLRLVFDTDGGSLVGELFVPHAVLTPEKMTDYLSVSDDVVFLDEDESEASEGWQFSTILDVHLGEDVRLDGYGLTGNLRGDLVVNMVPGMFMTGQGVLMLEDGQFSTYGRSLDIDRGRVLFSGGPIDDPGIDVRAQRVVADSAAGPKGIQVGVDVSGTAEEPEFKLFSDPYMDESDILAYMVVGRSMSDTGSDEKNILSSAAMALGVNKGTGLLQDLTNILPVDDVYFEGEISGKERLSLVVGKKLTDELFIGYDHNFFDQVGEMTIKYDLGKGFSIESRTSGDATGADLLFSFER